MSFIAPLALILSALAVPIILLYMLRLRRREVQVSSTLLWQQLLQDREANAPWQKLRRNLLLLLQLLILAALVIALARPYIEVPTVTTGRIALLIDASASMNATDVSPSRFEAAKARAADVINSLNPDDSVAVIRVAEGPAMLESYTNDRARLLEAVNTMTVSKGNPDWNAALTLAAAGAQGAEKFTILIVGDGGIPANLSLPQYGEVRFVPVGAAAENVAISALAPASDSAKGPQIYARISNYGPAPADVIFSLTLDGKLFSAAPYTVAANGYTDVTVTGLPPEFRQVKAEITRPTGNTQPDYLPLDDTAWAVYNPASAGRALLMARNNRFLENGLASLPDWQVFKGDPARGLPTDRYDLYVFDGWLPATLPDANILLINPPTELPPGVNLYVPGGLSPQTKITRVLPDDVRTRYLKFNDVNIREFRLLSGVEWATPLVVAEGGPIIYAGEFNGRRVAILSFQLNASDLPLKIAWPILLANLTEWYKAPRAVQIEGSLQPGQTLSITPLPGADTVRVSRPDGAITTFQVDQPVLIYADTPLTGIYTVDLYSGETLIRQEAFAVNLFTPAESQIAPRNPQGGGAAAGVGGPQEIGQREFWPLFLIAALGVLAVEWYVHHRRLALPRLRGGQTAFSRRGMGRPTRRA